MVLQQYTVEGRTVSKKLKKLKDAADAVRAYRADLAYEKAADELEKEASLSSTTPLEELKTLREAAYDAWRAAVYDTYAADPAYDAYEDAHDAYDAYEAACDVYEKALKELEKKK
jgi:hypothetical protein